MNNAVVAHQVHQATWKLSSNTKPNLKWKLRTKIGEASLIFCLRKYMRKIIFYSNPKNARFLFGQADNITIYDAPNLDYLFYFFATNRDRCL